MERKMSKRDEFILHKLRSGIKPTEIMFLLRSEGFAVPARQSLYRIIHRLKTKKYE